MPKKKTLKSKSDLAEVTLEGEHYALVIVASEKLKMLGPYYIPTDNISVFNAIIDPHSHVVVPELMLREAIPDAIKLKLKTGKKSSRISCAYVTLY